MCAISAGHLKREITQDRSKANLGQSFVAEAVANTYECLPRLLIIPFMNRICPGMNPVTGAQSVVAVSPLLIIKSRWISAVGTASGE